MKITIDRKVFASALSDVAPFAPQKSPVAILKYARITTKGTRMKIEANDAQCAMVRYIETNECDQDGIFLIDIAELNKFISKVKGDTIEMTVDGNTVKVRHSKGTAEFQTVPADEYPAFKMSDSESTELDIPTAALSDAVAKGKVFISTDILRPQICAIYAYTEGGKFGYCATDTHRLIHSWRGMSGDSCPDVNWYIMPSVFSAIMNACKTADMARVRITESHVQYTIGGFRIQSVQAKGSFPNFRRVIPQTWSMECGVGKSDMMDSTSRVSMFCPAQSRCIKFGIGRMDMTISADDLDTMKSSMESISHNGCDGEITIGVNADNITAALSVFNGDILMRMTDSSRPILLAEPGNDRMQVICMPMQLIGG